MKMTQGMYSLKNFNKLCMKLSHSTTLLSQMQHVKDNTLKKIVGEYRKQKIQLPLTVVRLTFFCLIKIEPK